MSEYVEYIFETQRLGDGCVSRPPVVKSVSVEVNDNELVLPTPLPNRPDPPKSRPARGGGQ